jgi:1-acyl-sn-glycerol-3-phosphate acyltransferase
MIAGHPSLVRGGLGPLGIVVYNLCYWPYLISTCIVLFLPALALFLLTFWDPKRRLLHRYTSYWGAHYLAWAPFAEVRVEGREHAERGGPYVFVVNHQSMVDILAVFAIHLPFLWVSKIENFRVPFLGWNMWLNGYVPLRRGFLPSILRMLRACLAKLAGGHSLCVFPEGTRSPDGTIQRFFRGAFWLAARARVPVVPVVIEGTGSIIKKGRLRIVPGLVTVRILEPVHPEVVGFDSKKLRDLVHHKMSSELERLRALSP